MHYNLQVSLSPREEAMSGPGVIPAVAGTAVLGARVFRGESLPATGFAIGIYVMIALACILVGTVARWRSSHLGSRKSA